MYSFIGISLLFTACVSGEGEWFVPKNFFPYRTAHYAIAVPNDFTFAEAAPRANYFYFGYPDGISNGMSLVKLFENETSCSPSITGASQTQMLQGTNEDTIWGRVDAFDTIYPGDTTGIMNVLCIPLSRGEAYALCSEKDGKRVLICISQMTDNPQLAEEIFRTFRWKE